LIFVSVNIGGFHRQRIGFLERETFLNVDRVIPNALSAGNAAAMIALTLVRVMRLGAAPVELPIPLTGR
jgi:hypothetical protein